VVHVRKNAPHQVNGAALVSEIFGSSDLAVAKVHVIFQDPSLLVSRDPTSNPQRSAEQEGALAPFLNVQNALSRDQEDVLRGIIGCATAEPQPPKKSPNEVVVIIEHLP
jgi:hypothetical protein